jgi:hypothetical protein
MGEAMTLWFVQRKGWVDFDHQDDWYTLKGPFMSEDSAEGWMREKHGRLGWPGEGPSMPDPEKFRLVRASLPFEVAS